MKSFQKNENWKTLKGKAKIQYIWDYYKFPLVILVILLYILVYALQNHLSYKETVLYTALVNVNASENLTERLSDDFLEYLNINLSRNKMELYTGLYLTEDEQNAYHEYTYASRIKILAVIDGKLLDVVLMNQEAFDAFSQNGYLCALEDLIPQTDAALYHTVEANCVTNITIIEDNAIERQFDSAIPYHAITEEHFYGINLSSTKLIRNAGFGEPVYLGILANSPRKDNAVAYLRYLFSQM
ncbi:MAG: hypothetical protein K1W16_17145 [Lachnospiraceae bacterium]|jgi:hypothetical protein